MATSNQHGVTKQEFKALTERKKAQRFRKALMQALDRYSLKPQSLRLVSMDSRPVFRIDTRGESFAAKFHDPSEHTLAQVQGEVRFLDFISRHTELCIEEPLANSKRSFVTKVESEWLPEPAHISICSWVPGRPLRDAVSARSYGLLGRCAAILHQVSPSFRPGRGFQILTNDRVFYWDPETITSRKDRKLLPKQRQEVFRKSAQHAQMAISRIWKSGKPIVIHGDLHPSNVKMHRSSLSLYDFEDIAWGFPQQDIGTSMYYIRFRENYAALLGAFRKGYEKVSPWPLASDRQLDQFVMARQLMLTNYVVNFDISPKKYLLEFEGRLRLLLGGKTS